MPPDLRREGTTGSSYRSTAARWPILVDEKFKVKYISPFLETLAPACGHQPGVSSTPQLEHSNLYCTVVNIAGEHYFRYVRDKLTYHFFY